MTSCTVMGNDTAGAEFLRFMEWLNEPENYRLFPYGHGGIDDSLVNGGTALTTDSRLQYVKWEQRELFRRQT